MKILQINSVCGIGSTGRIATDIHNILLKQGHESYIAYGRGIAKNCNNAIRIGSKFDNYAHALKTRISDKHGFGSKKATIEFIEKVKEINPDVIHLHNIHGYYINIEILFDYLKEANKPVVWTLHDCWAFTGHCTHFDYIGCERWKEICYNCPQKDMYPSSFFVDNSKGNYKSKKELFKGVVNMTIITPSNWLARLVKKSFLGQYPVRVINNGIDIDVFKPTISKFRSNNNIAKKFIILGVANNWTKRKGIQYFHKISYKLEKDEVIVLVGLSNKQSVGLPQNIIGITRTTSVKELAEIYSTADVFLNPTLEDNFPTTNLEALACGTPVITFNTGGSAECMDEKTGIISSAKDEEGLINAIKKMRENINTFNSFNCIERVRKYYRKDIAFEEYFDIYKATH